MCVIHISIFRLQIQQKEKTHHEKHTTLFYKTLNCYFNC